MNKKSCLKIVLLLFIVAVSNNVFAQAKPRSKAPKFKPPVAKTYLAGIRGSGDIVDVATGVRIIDSSLKVVDAKGNIYTITYYQFAFKRVGVTEDDSTGVVSPETDFAADHFTSTPLPPLWRNTIKETLIAGEEFHFFDIIVTDGKGQYFFAPEVKIGIK
jgi:hypothetical protein